MLGIQSLYQLEIIHGLSKYGLQTGITQQVALEYLSSWLVLSRKSDGNFDNREFRNCFNSRKCSNQLIHNWGGGPDSGLPLIINYGNATIIFPASKVVVRYL